MAREYPGKRVECKRALIEGTPLVLPWLSATARTTTGAGIDIFRCDDEGKIVEPWDVLQVIPPPQANSNTMF